MNQSTPTVTGGDTVWAFKHLIAGNQTSGNKARWAGRVASGEQRRRWSRTCLCLVSDSGDSAALQSPRKHWERRACKPFSQENRGETAAARQHRLTGRHSGLLNSFGTVIVESKSAVYEGFLKSLGAEKYSERATSRRKCETWEGKFS